MKKNFLCASVLFFVFTLFPFISHAQEMVEDTTTSYKAEVTEVVSETKEEIAETGVTHPVQEIKARILSGDKKNQIVTFRNDYITLKEGETFFLNHIEKIDDQDIYLVSDPYRLDSLLFLLVFLC